LLRKICSTRKITCFSWGGSLPSRELPPSWNGSTA